MSGALFMGLDVGTEICILSLYAVAFNRSDGTKVHSRALKNASYGLLVMLNEEQFFNVLEGKAQPPEPTPRDRNITVYPAQKAEEQERETEQFLSDRINHKRIQSLKRDAIDTPEGRVTIDMTPLENIARAVKAVKNVQSESESE